MEKARSTCQAAPRLIPLPAGTAVRSALAGGLVIGLMLFVTSPGGADPRDEPEPRTTSTESEPALVGARGNASTSANGEEPDDQDGSRTADLEAALDVALEEEAAAHAALVDAQAQRDTASDVQAEALATAEAAQDELMRTMIRLGDLITAQAVADTELGRAVARVERARAGSKARRSAFTDWQMDAVAERAAHARRAIAEDIGSRLFEEVNEAETALADAELVLGEASSAQRRAERAAMSASSGVTELLALVGPAGWPSSTAAVAPDDAQRVQP